MSRLAEQVANIVFGRLRDCNDCVCPVSGVPDHPLKKQPLCRVIKMWIEEKGHIVKCDHRIDTLHASG